VDVNADGLAAALGDGGAEGLFGRTEADATGDGVPTATCEGAPVGADGNVPEHPINTDPMSSGVPR
jgi:hypothetical protein